MSNDRKRKLEDGGMMSSIVDSLVGGTPVVPDTRKKSGKAVVPRGGAPVRQGRPSRSDDWGTYTIVARKDVYEKIRVISTEVGSPLKDVIDKMLQYGVDSYEQKYGAIKIPKKKPDLDSIF